MNVVHRPCEFHRLHRFGAGTIYRLVLVIAVLILATACNKMKEEAIPPGSVVLALGDSLTEGAGVSREEAWPSLLASRTGWVVINGGISGDTSEAALRRLPSLLDQPTPALVLVAVGGNDMLRHLPQLETITNLGKIIAVIRAHGAKPVLLATPNPSLMGAVFQHLSAADFYQQVADEQQVPLIKNAFAEVLSDPQYKGDPLHPNAAGHARIADKVFDALTSMGYIRKEH
jgi:acyl-CoA thioesterase I